MIARMNCGLDTASTQARVRTHTRMHSGWNGSVLGWARRQKMGGGQKMGIGEGNPFGVVVVQHRSSSSSTIMGHSGMEMCAWLSGLGGQARNVSKVNSYFKVENRILC